MQPHSSPDAAGGPTYNVAAQCLLSEPGHPHVESWRDADVHIQCVHGISNKASPTEWVWSFTNQYQLAATSVWRGGELNLVLESFRVVSITIDSRTEGVVLKNIIN